GGAGVMVVFDIGGRGGGGVAKAWVTPAVHLGGGDVPLWVSIVASVLIGGILSILAALYPAWRAAKMPPAAALRSEF
ncbi:MAG: hypothetical protein OEV33_00345, partial [Armatimonadota bacterium]|nr:hypothetical protein [Armatimonadota bacterium]